MKHDNRWAPVPTESGKVDGDSRSTAPSGEGVEPAQTPCAPGDAITRTLEAYGGQFYAQSITPSPKIPAELPRVNLEAGELEYLLALLVEQAVQEMPRGGVLSVVAYEETVWTSGFRLSHRAGIKLGRYVVLAVKDTGRGRVPELCPIQEVVARRGGGIVWQAGPRPGTRVNVYLPLVRLAEAGAALRISRR